MTLAELDQNGELKEKVFMEIYEKKKEGIDEVEAVIEVLKNTKLNSMKMP